MIPLGLSGAQHAKFNATLADTHSIAVRVQVLNLAGDRLSDVSDRLLDGQVNVDADADITRTCSLSLLDPNRRLHFDSDSPSDGALYLDRMVRVVYAVKVPTVGWVSCPVFTGPVTKLDREDAVVTVEASGKEVFAMGACWRPMTLKKGHNRIDAIRTILKERAGETRFSFPEGSARLPKDFALGRETVPWLAARRLARGIDKQLFYDGRGVARLRNHPEHVTFRFEAGDGGMVLTEPQVAYTTDEVKNIVWVRGGTPKGKKRAVSYWKAAPRSHPLSPVRLGRNGVPRYLLEVIDDGHIRSVTEAKRVAESKLKQLLLEQVEVNFDALPNPQLDPMDLVRVKTDEFGMTFRLKQFSLPLGTGDAMSLGYVKRVSVDRGAIRRR